MKTHIVREAFTLGANFYERGTELTDPAIITQARESHLGHLVPTSDDIPAPQPAADTTQSKAKPADAQ